MLIYHRFIIKNIIPSFLVIIFTITTLVWITQILKLLYLINKGIKLEYFCSLIVLVLPSLLFILMPLATSVATMYVYIYLSVRRKIIILQNLGLNNFQIAAPALLFSIIVTILSYYISFSLLPVSYNKLKENLNFFKKKHTSNLLTPKIFNKVSRDVSVYFDRKSDDSTMYGIIILDNRKIENQAVIFARTGSIMIDGDLSIFKLFNGIRQINDYNQNLTTLYFKTLILELINPINLNIRVGNLKDMNEYSVIELLKPEILITQIQRSKFIAEGHQRLIWPLYNFILVFLSLAIFLKQPYNKKSNLKQIIITVIIVMITIYSHFTLQNRASKNILYIYACYINVVISFIIGLYFYFKKSI